MEEKLNKGREILVDKLDLPAEIVMDIPKIIITGNKEITIENHKGISSFEKNLIKVNSKVGNINIEGSDFEILYIGGSTISITGKFKTIIYEDKQK